jgi:hypothetical protein
MDTESNAIPHPDPDTTDRVSDQLSLSQVATEVDLCLEPVTKYLTQGVSMRCECIASNSPR